MSENYQEKIKERIEKLEKVIEENLPELVKAAKNEVAEGMILHQDTFAVDYQDEEYYLLGMAIKYLGLNGKREIRIIGENRETLNN